jgi:hypothetical protein
VLAAPWYWLTYARAAAGFRYTWGFDFTAAAAHANLHFLHDILGLPILLLAAIGFVLAVARPRQSGPVAVGAAALFAAVWMFQVVVPAALQDRYLAPALPPLLILAVHGLAAMLERLAPNRLRAPLLACILGVAFLLTTAPGVVRKQHSGIIEAVQELLDHPVPGNPAVLLAADSLEEAEAIVEIAMHDSNRPHLFAVRGARLLGGGGYNTQDYQPLYATVAEAMAAIDAQAIPLVLVRSDGTPGEWEHVRQVKAAAAAWPDRWKMFDRVDVPDAPPVLLYRIVGNDTRPADPARLVALLAPHGL